MVDGEAKVEVSGVEKGGLRQERGEPQDNNEATQVGLRIFAWKSGI